MAVDFLVVEFFDVVFFAVEVLDTLFLAVDVDLVALLVAVLVTFSVASLELELTLVLVFALARVEVLEVLLFADDLVLAVGLTFFTSFSIFNFSP